VLTLEELIRGKKMTAKINIGARIPPNHFFSLLMLSKADETSLTAQIIRAIDCYLKMRKGDRFCHNSLNPLIGGNFEDKVSSP
jgi:hypothetical protein